MICWSCEREAGAGPLCAACGTVLPADEHQDRFTVLGVPRNFSVDLDAAESNFKKLSRQVHPDRFATADPRARKAALSRTVQLNEAWRTLKDPMRRAEYLLELAGFGLKGDDRKRGETRASETAATREVSAPPMLLMEILELREDLAAAQKAGNAAKVHAMAEAMRARRAAAMTELAAALDQPDGANLEEAAKLMVGLRYFQRFLDEIPGEAHEASHG